MRYWTLDDNYTAIGYLNLAIEHYNKYSADGDKYPPITQEQAKKLAGCMLVSFDEHAEQEAYNKA